MWGPQVATLDPHFLDYFRALGIPLLKGRFFSPSDRVEGDKNPMIVIINETMAKHYFNGKDPISVGRL
jgi:hypothetical protein